MLARFLCLPTLLLPLLLGACTKEQEQAKQSFSHTFRSKFIAASTQECVAAAPSALRNTEPIQKICECSAENAYEKLTATEIAQAVTGSISEEARAKLIEAASSCFSSVYQKSGAHPNTNAKSFETERNQ